MYAKKADLVADVDEKKSIYYQVGAVFERELGDVPQAIDTYTKILELDPDDLQALSRLDVLYEQAKNWGELLSVLMRESEMTGDANEAISFQYRIAELYEKHLDDVPRAVELYREILQRQPDHEPTLRALEGLKDGDKDPLVAAAVLEPVYEASSDWRKLIGVHEVQVRHATDLSRKSSCCIGSPACTKTRWEIMRRRSTRTRGRCPSTTATTRPWETARRSGW